MNMATIRKRYREAHERGAGGGHAWANEGFSFSPDEYKLVTALNPDLVATDREIRRRAWVKFSDSSLGKAFRVR